MAPKKFPAVVAAAITTLLLGAVLPHLQCGYARDPGVEEPVEGVTKALGKVGKLDIPAVGDLPSLPKLDEVLPKNIRLPDANETNPAELLKKLGPLLSALGESNPSLEALGSGESRIDVSEVFGGKLDFGSEETQKAFADLLQQRAMMEDYLRKQFTELAKRSVKKALVEEKKAGDKGEEGVLDLFPLPGVNNGPLPGLDLIEGAAVSEAGGLLGDANLGGISGSLGPLGEGLEKDMLGNLGGISGGLEDFRQIDRVSNLGKNLRARASLEGIQNVAGRLGSKNGTFLEGFAVEDEEGETEDDDSEPVETRAGLTSLLDPLQASAALTGGLPATFGPLAAGASLLDSGVLNGGSLGTLSLDPTSITSIKELGPLTAAFEKAFDPETMTTGAGYLGGLTPIQSAGEKTLDLANLQASGGWAKQIGDSLALGQKIFDASGLDANFAKRIGDLSGSGVLDTSSSSAGTGGLAALAPIAAGAKALGPKVNAGGAGGEAAEVAQALQLIQQLKQERANWKAGQQFAESLGVGDVFEQATGMLDQD